MKCGATSYRGVDGQLVPDSSQRPAAPLDLTEVQAELAGIGGVVDVPDLHMWTLTSEMEVATARLMVAADTDSHAVLDRARELLAERHGITQTTLQVEPDDHRGCQDVSW